MKAVCTADFHIHPYRICSRDGGHDRLLDGLSCLRQSLALAREESAAWVFAGDFKLPKTSWPQSALTGAHAILREYPDVAKVMVAGNHDALGLGGSGLAPFKDVAMVVEDPAIVTLADGTEVVCAPWNADLAVVAKLQDGTRPLFAHAFLAGCMLGPEDTRIAKGVPVSAYGDFPVAVFGDVHKGQWRRSANAVPGCPATWFAYSTSVVRAAATPWVHEVFYAGSPYQQNWGERNDPQKGALVIDLAAGTVTMSPFIAPRFIHIDVETEDGLAFFIRTREQYAGDFVRVVYSGPPSMVLGAARNLGDDVFRSFDLIVRRPPDVTVKRADVHAGLPVAEILTRYVAARTPPGESSVALTAGLRLVEDTTS